jgi:hypothetical protein
VFKSLLQKTGLLLRIFFCSKGTSPKIIPSKAYYDARFGKGGFLFEDTLQFETGVGNKVSEMDCVRIRATAEDGYDSVVRILNDLQRSGFDLLSLRLTRSETAAPSYFLEVEFSPQSQVWPDEVANRLARHPSLLTVHATG